MNSSNVYSWLYSQKADLDFYTLRIMVNLEYSLMNLHKQERLRSEKKALFFGTRLGFCNNDSKILSSFEKESPSESNTREFSHKEGDSEFKVQIRVIKNL